VWARRIKLKGADDSQDFSESTAEEDFKSLGTTPLTNTPVDRLLRFFEVYDQRWRR
jgi:hypothetical protein